jgi:4-hydroxymandelate oxidase
MATEGTTLVIVSVDDYRGLARERISAHNWDYIEGGSGAELTLDANRRAFDAAWLRPRVLVDVSSGSTALRLLGSELSTPVGIAPTAFHRMADPEGECATVRGAGSVGALHVVSMLASRTLEDIAADAASPLWMQLYWLRDRRKLAELATRTERAGYRALVLTVDAPRLAQRRRDLRNAFVLDADIEPVNLAAADSALQHRREDGQSALARHAAVAFDASVTWSDLAWLRGVTGLPLVVKGVLTAEDARVAVEHGVDGIVVSNHGGRQLDGAVPAMVALPEVVAAVAGRCPVLLDGSVRSGRDVFVALALGASAVLVGRPVLWGLAVSGAEGVADVLARLTAELAAVMALAGRPRLADIDRSAIV